MKQPPFGRDEKSLSTHEAAEPGGSAAGDGAPPALCPRRSRRRFVLLVALLTSAGLLACATRPVVPPRTPEELERATERARSLAESLATSSSSTGEDLSLSGWLAWMHDGDADLAVERFERALELDPESALGHLGLARVASSRLDEETESRHYLEILTHAPGDPLALLAVDGLGWSLGSCPELDDDALATLRSLEGDDEISPRLRIAARHLLASRLDARSDDAGYSNAVSVGAPDAWSVAGPFSRFTWLEPNDAGTVILRSGEMSETYEGPLGEVVTWMQPSSEGALAITGARGAGDVYYAAVDLVVPEEGTYLVSWATESHVDVSISGVQVFERDASSGSPPTVGLEPLSLSEGRHRLIARLLVGVGGGGLELALLDARGRAAGISMSPAFGEAPEQWVQGDEEEEDGRRFSGRDGDPPVEPLKDDSSLLEDLRQRVVADPSGALAPYLAASYLEGIDREFSKALVELLMPIVPSFAPGHYLSASIAYGDPALPRDLRRGRAGAAAMTAAKLDPMHGWARLMAASIAVEQDRYDAAAALLDEVAEIAPLAADLVFERSRLYSARGQQVLAREAVETGLAARPTQCSLLRAVHRARRQDLDLEGLEETAPLLERCGIQGRLALVEHLSSRGHRQEALEILGDLVEARPMKVRERLRLVDLLLSEGLLEEAGRELAAMRDLWPNEGGPLLRLADLAARQGDDEAARELRLEYLELVPHALHVRRALAFQEGRELLDWGAVDLEAKIEEYLGNEQRREWGTDSVLVVDHAAVEVFAEDPEHPAVVERVQMVTEVLTQEGLDRQGEVSVPRGAEIVSLHTRKRDGRVFEPEITPHKDTITLSGLEVGDFVVIDYLSGSPRRNPALPGWAASPFYVRVFGMPLHSVTYVARAPRSVGLEIEARNVEVDEAVEEDGYLVFRYEDGDVAPLLPEHDSPGADEILPWIRVGAGATPAAYGDAWGDYVAGRARVDHEVRGFTDAVTADLPREVRDDPRALTHALAAAVSKHVLGQVPSTSFGDRPSHALVRGRGNRLTATRAVLEAQGLDSRIALVRPFDADPGERRFPAGDLFDYAVLRVDPGDGGPPIWIDQNIRTAPLGALRPIHGGRPAILLAEPGRPTEIVTTPEIPRSQETRRSALELRIDERGNLLGRGMDTYQGFWGAIVRTGMARADDDRRRQAVEGSLSQSFGLIRLNELSFEGADDDAEPGAPMIVTYEFEVDGWARVRGDRIEAPGGSLFPALMSRNLIRLSDRELPMLLQSETIRELEATFELPEGYVLAEEPEKIDLRTHVGRFQRDVDSVVGRVTVREHLELDLKRVMPEEYQELVEFAAEVDRAQARGLPFEETVAEQ